MESEANIQTNEPAAPAMERVTDAPTGPDSQASIMGDLRQAYNQPAPPAPEQAPAVVPAPVTEPPPDATPTAPLPDAPTETAPVVEPEPPTPESHLAPLFTLATLPAEESLPKAVELVTSLQGYDPLAHKLLVNSVYQTAPETFKQWVLGDMGIEPAKVDQFMGWLKNGGPQAPVLGAFPVPDTEGWVTLPNGSQFDTTTTEGMERYETQKALHELRVERQQETATREAEQAERLATTKAAEQARVEQEQLARVDSYVKERYTLRDQLVDDAVKSLAPEDKFFGDMFRAYVKDHIDNQPDLLAVGKEAGPHVPNGTGRVVEFARKSDSIIRKEINTLKDNFSRHILRLNRAEIAATTGQPKVLPGTKTVESYVQPQPGENEPQTFDEIRRQAQRVDQQIAGANRY